MRWLKAAFNPDAEEFSNIVTAVMVAIIVGIFVLYWIAV